MFETKTARALKALFLLLIFAAVGGLMAVHAFNPARDARLHMLQRHHDRMVTLNNRLAEQTERLDAELTTLQTSADGWRSVARREFGMLQPGEVIYRFPTEEREPR